MEMPIHTESVVEIIARSKSSFNQIMRIMNISPSTLSRILKFLKGGGLIDVKIIEPDTRGPRKIYFLTRKGLKAVPLFATMKRTTEKVMKMTRK